MLIRRARLSLLLAAILTLPSLARAERTFVKFPQYLSLTGGAGLTRPYDRAGDDEQVGGVGAFAAGEFVLALSDWFQPRAYAGLLLTFPDDGGLCVREGVDCDVTAKLFFLGGKGRFVIPIPYIAPFLELGLGASIGTMRTKTLVLDEEMKGITYHIPVGLGIALGSRHEWEIMLSYMFHPTEKQVGGAVVIGVSILLFPGDPPQV